MAEALKIYPSGFLGSAVVAQTRPIDVVTTARRLFNKGLNPTVSKYVANQEIADLWDSAHVGTSETKTWAFKERVLRAAKEAFGTEFVIDWINTQAESPAYSDYHRRWIDETLAFIFEGKPRAFSENNWRVLLTADQAPFQGERVSRLVKHYLLGEKLRSATHAEPFRGTLTIVDLIAAWCAREGGFNDLLGQLNNLFGKR